MSSSSRTTPSYHRQGSSSYQNVPSIFNDANTDNVLDTNDNISSSYTDSEAASFLSPPTPGRYEPREDLGKRNWLYIAGVFFAFLILMSLVHGDNSNNKNNNSKTAVSADYDKSTKHSNAWDRTPIVQDMPSTDETHHAASSSSSSSSTTVNAEDKKTKNENTSTMPSSSSSSEVSLAYLLSYPRSGTTFTTDLIAALAQSQYPNNNQNNNNGVSSAIASNYHEKCATDENGNVFPVFTDQENGPCYIPSPNSQSDNNKNNNNKNNSKDKKYVVTISHCAGRCPYASINCPPSDYIETYESFESSCRTTSYTSISFLSSSSQRTSYPPTLIQKVIHLYRNPLSNVLSQYHKAHSEYKHQSTDPTTLQWLQTFPSTKDGFQKWCATNYTSFLNSSEEKSFLKKYFTKKVLSLFTKIPCPDEFYRYIQFHNYVYEVRKYRQYNDSIKMYYEDYATREKEVATSLYQFLEYGSDGEKVVTNMMKDGKLPTYYSAGDDEGGSSTYYEEYYTEEQRVAIWELMRVMAHPEAWKDLEYYYDGQD